MNAAAVDLAGITIHAPASVITNVMLSAQAAWLARRTLRPWSVFLGLLGFGASFGALKHGTDNGAVHEAARVVSNLGLGAAAAWAACRGLPGRVGRDPSSRRASDGGTAPGGCPRILLGAFAGWSVLTVVVPSFLVVVVWMAALLGAVGAAEAARALRGDRSAARTVAGMAIGCGAAAAYLGGASLGPWVGPIDVAHVICMAALPFMGRRRTGARRPVPAR